MPLGNHWTTDSMKDKFTIIVLESADPYLPDQVKFKLTGVLNLRQDMSFIMACQNVLEPDEDRSLTASAMAAFAMLLWPLCETVETSLQGILPFRNFTIHYPSYFMIRFQDKFHDFKEKFKSFL